MGGGESKPKGSTNVPCSLRVSAKLPRYHTNTAAIDKHIHHLIFFLYLPPSHPYSSQLFTQGTGTGTAAPSIMTYDVTYIGDMKLPEDYSPGRSMCVTSSFFLDLSKVSFIFHISF